MKLCGGYNLRMTGRPASRVDILPEPDVINLPLWSRRFNFTELCVEEGEHVHPGQRLARDPANHSVPLLAPRAGTVRLDAVARHIVLDEITREPEEAYHPGENLLHVPKGMGSVGMKRYVLLALGAWQFFHDAHTGELPDPFGIPRAVIVSTLHLEPFVARGDVQLHKRLPHLTRGLEHLQGLLEYQPIYLVMPDIESKFARQVRDTLRGYAFVKMVQVPRRYPFDDFAILARALGLRREADAPVWGVTVEGILAIDRALTLSRPSTVRIVSLGGPGAKSPRHLKAIPGYPLKAILNASATDQPVRVINGGVLRGETMPPDQLGLDTECQGLTLLPEVTEREFMGFVQPGFDRRSYSNCFLSVLRGRFYERLSTATRGEERACVSCGFCEEVCPARIMPYLIHKYLYQDELEEAERLRTDLCVKCGLCSYVCPSKIELRKQLAEAQERIQLELHVEEVSE